MTPSAIFRSYTCARCLRANRRPNRPLTIAGGATRSIANAATQRSEPQNEHNEAPPRESEGQDGGTEVKEEGAFTRRMRQMSEEALESGGYGAIKAVEEAGFSAELKAQLEQRIAAANLRSSEASLAPSASRHTRPCDRRTLDWHRVDPRCQPAHAQRRPQANATGQAAETAGCTNAKDD
jgi:hypothetical protein